MDLPDPSACLRGYNDLDDGTIARLLALLKGIQDTRNLCRSVLDRAQEANLIEFESTSTKELPTEQTASTPLTLPNPESLKRSRPESDESYSSSFFRRVDEQGYETEHEEEVEGLESPHQEARQFLRDASPPTRAPTRKKRNRKGNGVGKDTRLTNQRKEEDATAVDEATHPDPTPSPEPGCGDGVGRSEAPSIPQGAECADGDVVTAPSPSYASAAASEAAPVKTALKQTREKPRREEVRALIVEGLSRDQAAQPAFVNRMLGDLSCLYYKTVCTKGGNRLLYPKTKGDSERLQGASLPDGVRIREVKPPSRPNTSVLMVGVHPDIGEEYLSEKSGMKCRRMKDSSRNGIATWKVRVFCGSAEQKREILEKGLTIDRQKYRVQDYRQTSPVLQCHRCSDFGHIAAACKKQQICKRCGEAHKRDACEAEIPKCPNCGEGHEASDFACVRRKAVANQKEAVKLTHQHTVTKGGDQIEALRLACTVATVLGEVLREGTGSSLPYSVLCSTVARSVAKFYRVDIKVEHILHLIKQ